MYAASTTSTTTSSRLSAGACAGGGGGERRVRSVRLVRPRRSAPAFGFSLRGGREHATGFFISKVEFNSEAHLQGLKVGDQVVSVNGYRVDDAIHTELAHYVAAQSRLNIKVRNVGLIPVKDKVHEHLSWQCVSERASLGSGTSASPTLCETERLALRLSILVPPRAKLGCGICKGPEWKPGIFVQFVREGGIAREAGLRPGDQILSCNGLNFGNITFNEAIAAMKASGRLELLVREGAGAELVSPESSGYNSSASSAAGERSPAPSAPAAPLAPPAALRRRLASVAEEAADRADRLNVNRLKRRTWDSIDFDWKTTEDIHNFDAPSDIEPDYDSPSIPNNPHTYESQKKNQRKKEFITNPSNRTIINLTEDGAMIQCSYENPRKTTFSNLANKENDKKTIVVEVHHMNNKQCASVKCKPPPPMKKESSSDSSSLASSTTLSNAIAEEIQRRKQLKKTTSQDPSKPEVTRKISASKPVENEKKKQHDALMDEFKKVHRKMFANQDTNGGESDGTAAEDSTSLDRQQTLPLRKVVNGTSELVTNGFHAKRDSTDSTFKSRDRVEKLPLRKTEKGSEDAVTNGHHTKRDSGDDPPPPPPMPTTNGLQNGKIIKVANQIQMINNSEQTNGSGVKNGMGHRNGSLTRTPTPDYNTQTDPEKTSQRDERAELESIESYTLKNPNNVQHKPPSTYFMRAPNGTATMKKHVRPVSVTIGEYGSGGGIRRQPSKLEFLNGDKTDGSPPTDDLSNRLQSELALTLSRSNLRKKTDTLVDGGR